MPNINLIAARREEKQRITTLTRQLFMGFVGSAAVLFGVFVFITGQKFAKQMEIRNLDEKMKKLQPKLDEIAAREKDIKELKPRVETLDNARLSTLRWRALMAVLSESIPKTVWVTSVLTTGDLSSSSVNLKGIGPSQAIIGDISTRLYQKGIFDHVDIVSTNNGSAPEDPVQKISFEMNAFLLPATLSTAPAPAPSPSPAAPPSSSINSNSSTTTASVVMPASLLVRR